MIEDFAAENCKYLEIRSTPRAMEGSTEQEYVEALLNVLQENEGNKLGITTRLVLSVDRSNTTL